MASRKRRTARLGGSGLDDDEPNWQPLLELLASDVICDFMWMHAVELEDGRRLEVYKHWWTRRYIHLDANGNAFFYTDDGKYEHYEDAYRMLRRVLAPHPEARLEWSTRDWRWEREREYAEDGEDLP